MIKIKWIICLLVGIVLFTGCDGKGIASVYNDDEKIAGTSNTFNITGYEQSIDGQKLTGTVEKIEGMDTIWTYEADEDKELNMTYMLNVKSGKLKLVLITPDGAVINIIESSKETDLTGYAVSTFRVNKGLNRIKMVGAEDTSVEFDIEISEGTFEKLGL